MTSHALESVALILLAEGKGILAADETIPTLTKRFDTLGIQSTEQSRRTYREMLFTCRGAAEFISGAIMYDETIRRKRASGKPLAEALTSGPEQGGPGLVANAYLEGTYSEVYPNISPDEAGRKRLFTRSSFPGGIPSRVAPETPGPIREGHVSGSKEEGTATTRFDVRVLNDLARFHLVSDVIDRVPKLGSRAAYAKQAIGDKLIEHRQYICWHGDDMPEITDWRWSQEVASTGCVLQRWTMSDPSRLRR
jgi:hypothetical protein